jgi:hypothetical protein
MVKRVPSEPRQYGCANRLTEHAASRVASIWRRHRFGYDAELELFCCRMNRKSDNPEHEEQPCESSQRNCPEP